VSHASATMTALACGYYDRMGGFEMGKLQGQTGGLPQKIWEEWLGFPAKRMVDGRFPLPEKPGLGFDLSEEALKKYPFGDTRPMARVFHEDGSVAAW